MLGILELLFTAILNHDFLVTVHLGPRRVEEFDWFNKGFNQRLAPIQRRRKIGFIQGKEH